jgi:hypothetical protein
MGRYYILCGGAVLEEPDFSKWVAWHASRYEKLRCVARTSVKFGAVVTVFLGMNMALTESARPLLFETRVMGGWLDGQGERYSTLEQARAGHEALVAQIRAMEQENELPPPDCTTW